jgi:hypothetical protein
MTASAPTLAAVAAALCDDATLAQALSERMDMLLCPTRPRDVTLRRTAHELAADIAAAGWGLPPPF